MNKQKDWRANIIDYRTMYDLDYVQVMVFLRHEYLATAKDLLHSDDPDEQLFADKCLLTAIQLEGAIDYASGPVVNPACRTSGYFPPRSLYVQ